MDAIDNQYINLLSSRLERFKKVRAGLYNCRCILCGDSHKNKTKARGYFYEKGNNTNYKCHNCGVNISLNNFLKQVDYSLYESYCLEKYKKGLTGKNFVVDTPKINKSPPSSNRLFKERLSLPKASENDKSRKYLEDRLINPKEFYYAKEFKKWVNSVKPTFNEKSLYYEEERIVIPFHLNKELIGFQGRTFGDSQIKYITIMLDDKSPKVYNYDQIDNSKPVYILEGPFDSCFIQNSIAMCGADVSLEKLNISQPVYVYDNEPRNIEILNRMQRTILKGLPIVIWPQSIKQKDVNLMVLEGLDVNKIISENVYTGLLATLNFNEWKKK
jgi:hypothetical protein